MITLIANPTKPAHNPNKKYRVPMSLWLVETKNRIKLKEKRINGMLKLKENKFSLVQRKCTVLFTPL